MIVNREPNDNVTESCSMLASKMFIKIVIEPFEKTDINLHFTSFNCITVSKISQLPRTEINCQSQNTRIDDDFSRQTQCTK